jgi:hypothetical protein
LRTCPCSSASSQHCCASNQDQDQDLHSPPSATSTIGSGMVSPSSRDPTSQQSTAPSRGSGGCLVRPVWQSGNVTRMDTRAMACEMAASVEPVLSSFPWPGLAGSWTGWLDRLVGLHSTATGRLLAPVLQACASRTPAPGTSPLTQTAVMQHAPVLARCPAGCS